MKIKGLDNKEHVLNTAQSKHRLRSEKTCKSKLQYEVGQLLKTKYPMDTILEEVSLPGSNGLYLDFLLPTRRLGVEVQGRQHGEYVPFFHGSKKGYLESKERDYNKELWCELNNIQLMYFNTVEEAKEVLGL